MNFTQEATYEITWTDGGTETVRTIGTVLNGWVPVRGGRWINLATARSVEPT